MIRYELLKVETPLSTRNSYGILGKEKRDGDWVSVVVAAPFSGDPASVDKLAEKCTSLQPSPEQLIDIVSDFILKTITLT